MTFVAIAIAAAVCGWSVLLVISDERQRALTTAHHSQVMANESKKSAGSEKRKN